MSKDTKIISDLRSFFAKNDDNRAIKCIMGVMEHINIRSSQIGVEKKENCKFTTLQVLNLLMLFPFFVVKNASRYSNSSLSKLFNCDKDMFYRFMNDGNVKHLQKEKAFEAYETIGGLFTEVTNATLELSVTDKIWAIILDFVLEAAERYSIDATELLADFIESNPVAHTLCNMYIYKQAS